MELNKVGIYRRFFKRPMDFVLSLVAIIVLSPVFLVVAILVRTKLGSPVLFRQERPGLNEEIFEMYKFRSMTDEKNSEGKLLPDSARLTAFGRFLRSASMDELPGLFNILKGDMSIIGPRPFAVQYLPYYSTKESLRHTVRPGLSGLAQINGRNTVNWEDRFKYDIQYVREISFSLDLYILIKTFAKVFKRDGIAVRGTTKVIDFDVHRKTQLKERRFVQDEYYK